MKPRIGAGKKVFLIVTAASVIAVVLLAVLRPRRPVLEAPPEQRVAVTVMEVAPRAIRDVIVLPGRVMPFRDIIVAAEQAGRVTALEAREGWKVRRGDTLLRIDDRTWRAGLRRAELAEIEARRDLARLKDLRRTGAVSQSEYESAETRAETAGLALEEAGVFLDRCAPAAPLDGRVEERLVETGEYVNPGQPLFRLIDTERVRVRFDVPERDVLKLRSGAEYVFRLDALPDRAFGGELGFVAAAAEPANNAFRAELWAGNPDGAIRAGMLARVELARDTIADAVALPLRAVVPLKGETVAYVAEHGHAVRRVVRIGAVIDGQAVITGGIAAGDRVILDGNRAVLDGTPVRIVEDWQPAPPDGMEHREP